MPYVILSSVLRSMSEKYWDLYTSKDISCFRRRHDYFHLCPSFLCGEWCKALTFKFHYCFLIVQHLDKTEQYATIPIAAKYFTFRSTVNNINLCHIEASFSTKIQCMPYFVSNSASYKDITLVAIARSKLNMNDKHICMLRHILYSDVLIWNLYLLLSITTGKVMLLLSRNWVMNGKVSWFAFSKQSNWKG